MTEWNLKYNVDKLVRSARKTLAIEVSKNGEVVVRAPERMPERRIKRFVRGHTDWIERSRAEMIAKSRLAQKRYEPGERFLYLGDQYRLSICRTGERSFVRTDTIMLEDNRFVLSDKIENPRDCFKTWYRSQAQQIIPTRIQEIASQHGYEYAKVRISSAKRIWGSCSGKNNISISWRVIMAPIECVDYVILHELVHTVHKHHGKWFWARVGRAMPDYKMRRKWLRDNEHLMRI